MLIARKVIKTIASSLDAENLAELRMYGAAPAGSPPAMPAPLHRRPAPKDSLAAELGVGRERVRLHSGLGSRTLQEVIDEYLNGQAAA